MQNQPLHVFFASKEQKEAEEVQETLPLGSRSSNTTAKRGRGRPKKQDVGEDVVNEEVVEDKEDVEDVEDKENTPEDASVCSGRRSGRIAKTANILQVFILMFNFNSNVISIFFKAPYSSSSSTSGET